MSFLKTKLHEVSKFNYSQIEFIFKPKINSATKIRIDTNVEDILSFLGLKVEVFFEISESGDN